MKSTTTKRPNPKTIKPFKGGTCDIEEVLDEPGRRYWVRVRFDARQGAGFQFETWEDEMHYINASIADNFTNNSNIVGMPLAAPTT